MSNYTYKAKDKVGNTVTGSMEADCEKTVAGRIRELGQYPIEIRSIGAPRTTAPAVNTTSPVDHYLVAPFWTGVNIRHLALFYRQLATMLHAGLSLTEALRSIGNRTRGRLGVIIQEAIRNLDNGRQFSDTLARYPHIFGRLQVSLVRAGESSGLMDSMVDRIASYLEYELTVRRMIIKMITYPMFIFVFIILIITCLPYVKMLAGGSIGPFLWAVLPGLRNWALGIAATYIVLKFVFQFTAVKFVWDSVKILPPVLGTSARKIAMSRFSRALAVLYSAGLPISDSVSIAAESCGNILIGNQIKRAIPRINEGVGLTESLVRTGALLPMVVDMLVVGEKTGDMDPVLQKVSEYMDSEVDVTIQKSGIALFVLLIVIAGVIVGFVALSFYAGYFGKLLGGS